jgi:hypothetical protein
LKRGLAGLIAVLLLSAFVALGADGFGVPQAAPTAARAVGAPAVAGSTSTPALRSPVTHVHADGHRHVHLPEAVPADTTPTSEDAADGVVVLGESSLCGPGSVAIRIDARRGVGCTHAGVHTNRGTLLSRGIDPLEPVCFGNGVNGNRVHAIYAYPAGQPDRSDEWIPRIANELIPRVEANVRMNSKAGGREIGVRWLMPGCKLEVTTVELPANTADWNAGVSEQFGRIVTGLARKGFSSDHRKYLTWFDGFSKGGVCGIAFFVSADETPLPTNVHNGVSPTGLLISPNVAVTFDRSGGGIGDHCWGSGSSGARTETHELFHTLGAVFPSSPNSDRAGHCLDGDDILCYGDGAAPRPVVRQCFGPIEALDCNQDDYFNPRPPLGSYLSTRWNTANSSFLASSPLDLVPVAVPLP